jgi:hypothetical protein
MDDRSIPATRAARLARRLQRPGVLSGILQGLRGRRVGAPPSVPTGAPIPAVAPRPQPAPDGTGADDLPPAPVSTLHAKDEPAEGFPEIACSPNSGGLRRSVGGGCRALMGPLFQMNPIPDRRKPALPAVFAPRTVKFG